jgi:aspartyl-tRNA synthetase
VLVRGRVHTVRGKGKTAFLVIRQRTATVQAVMFVDDTTVSRGMVKYASSISRESVVDVAGTVAVPENPVTSCTQSQARSTACLLSITWFRQTTTAAAFQLASFKTWAQEPSQESCGRSRDAAR